MPDILTQQTVSAEFKGVTFRVREEALPETGRRRIVHEYPNSSERFVEDLGFIPPKFTIDAFIHGQNFLQQAIALESVLNEETPGPLTLPTFGTFEVYALAYSKNASQQSVGEIRYSLSFVTGRPNPGPLEQPREIEDLYEAADVARGRIETAFVNAFNTASGAVDAINSSFNRATAIFDTNDVALTLVDLFVPGLNSEQLTDFNSRIETLKFRGRRLYSAVQSFAQALVRGSPESPGVFQIASVGSLAGVAFDPSLRGVNFGSNLSIQSADILGSVPTSVTSLPRPPFNAGISQWETDTAERQLRNQIRRLLVQTFRLCSLVSAYEQAAATNFQNEQQITNARQLLAEANQAATIDTPDTGEAIQTEPLVTQSVNEVRFIALDILERKEQASPSVGDIFLNTSRTSLELSYALYAEQFSGPGDAVPRALLIRGLNPLQAAMGLDKDVSILDRERQ